MLAAPADLSPRVCGLLLSLLLVAVCALAKPGPGEPMAVSSRILTSYRDMPVRLCVPMQAEDWTALRGGAARLVLHIQNLVPSRFYSRTYQVSLVGTAEPRRVPVDQLSTQPDNAPHGGGPPGPQNFAIDLHGHLPAAPEPATLCLEVGADPQGGNDTEPGEAPASHRLRVWATLEPHGAQGGQS
jgi:hypothetical protein